MRVFEKTNFDFVGKRKLGYIISGVLLAVSIGSLIIRGPHFGIDFLGGQEFQVKTDSQLEAGAVRSVLDDALGTTTEVKLLGQATELLVRVPTAVGEPGAIQNGIETALKTAFPGSNPEFLQSNVIGPRFAADLKRGALWSVIFSLIVIFLYILVRFEWRFGLGAVAALTHDVIIVLGLFSLLHGILPFALELNQVIIAALLTIVGYSLNDTVVVFDRIREYASIFKTEAYELVVNKSLNSTLSRTVMTSVTTLIVVTVLFIAGGEGLRGFAFALILGILIGTYSSVFVASPVVVELKKRSEKSRK